MKRESWLPAAPESAGAARAIVREAAAERGLGAAAAWDLMLATTEAVANAVQHGEACAPNGGIRLRITASEDGLWVEVCDCGRFDGGSKPEYELATRGRGIPLISAVMDSFEVMPEEPTRVRFGKLSSAAAA